MPRKIRPPGADLRGFGIGKRLASERDRHQAAVQKALQPIGQHEDVLISEAGERIAGLGRVGHTVGVEDDPALIPVGSQIVDQLRKGHVYRAENVKCLVLAWRAHVNHHQALLIVHNRIGQFFRLDVIFGPFDRFEQRLLGQRPSRRHAFSTGLTWQDENSHCGDYQHDAERSQEHRVEVLPTAAEPAFYPLGEVEGPHGHQREQ